MSFEMKWNSTVIRGKIGLFLDRVRDKVFPISGAVFQCKECEHAVFGKTTKVVDDNTKYYRLFCHNCGHTDYFKKQIIKESTWKKK